LFAALAAFVNTGQAQVTLSQITNGLVSWYPLDFVITNGSTITAPDFIGGRDMTMVNMNGANVIASTRPSQNAASISNCFNFNQAGATIMYYQSKGQHPLDGSGDFLPFCNQINATMNFWIKFNSVIDTNGTHAYRDKRLFGECGDGTAAGTSPIWLFGTDSAGTDAAGGLNNNTRLHFLFRNNTGNSAFESFNYATPQTLVDGTKQLPDFNGYWQQPDQYTGTNVLDGSWHMFTMSIDSNRVVDIYIDGVRDLGPGSVGGTVFTDIYGNPNYGPPFPLTNVYYTTNIFASAGVSNPPPNGYVRWMWNGIFQKAATAFGGFRREGANNGGFPMLYDDIGFWNRRLDTNEIAFIYTNGIYGVPLVRPLQIESFTADLPEVGKGDFVTLRWNVIGANTTSGGIIISGVGDVSTKGLIGSTNVTLNGGDQSFTLTVHNGVAPDTNATLTVKTFGGVSSSWHLIERFENYADTSADTLGGLNANNWISSGGDFSGSFDKWNVVDLVNSGATNKVLAPRAGYVGSTNSSGIGFQTRGALSYAKLGSLAILPGKTNTLFFRFSLREPGPEAQSGSFLLSDMDFGVGVSDYGFLGPSAGLGYYGGTGGGLGPYFSIIRNSQDTFAGAPFNLFAPDRNEADGTTTNTFNYTNIVASGLDTNVNYMVWMDIENYNTHSVTNGSTGFSNTVNEAQYSVWLQKQGDPTRTLLFNNFHGNRDYITMNTVNDTPSPILDKVFFNIGSEDITATPPAERGAYFGTNMIAIDDIYISKSGVNGTVPRLFDITSIVKGSSSITLKWDSLGSMFGTTTYQIQRSATLVNPTWTTLATIPSGGSTTSYTDSTIGSADTAFYRIVWP
jgi:hypothetical protein